MGTLTVTCTELDFTMAEKTNLTTVPVSGTGTRGSTVKLYDDETLVGQTEEPYEQITLWDAAEYGQENPLTTNSEGEYAWDVPEGLWSVVYEKEGYVTEQSDWMEVPPPQLDVNVGLVSYEAPVLEKVLACADGVVNSNDLLAVVKYVSGRTAPLN